jgi:carbonic anhydrase
MYRSRAAFLIGASAAFLAVPGTARAATKLDEPATCPELSVYEAQRRLVYGNQRYVSQTATHASQTTERREATATAGQCPFAMVLTCADSRVIPELVFDRGLGDLFVCRTAGNVEDPIVIGSLQYAFVHYHPPLLVVLGHEKCGAVEATLEWLRGAPTPSPSIYSVVAGVRRSVRTVMAVEEAVRLNASGVASRLRNQPWPSPEGKPRREPPHIAAAYYSMSTGHVRFL